MSESATSDAHEVADWLRQHPDFLQKFPDLALILTLPREQGKAASLASYQLDILREKNRELNRRLHELFAISEDNERLAVRTHQLTLALMRQTDRAGVVRAMAAGLSEDFNGDLVRIVLFAPVEGMETIDEDWLRIIPREDARLVVFAEVLDSDEPRCGRLPPEQQALLYAAHADDIHASALLPLPGIGLVVIGSRDGNRFWPGMGTLFLRMMGEAFAAALRRFDG